MPVRQPINTIEMDFTHRLMMPNAVEATVSESNAATAVAKAFLEGAGVTEGTQWRPELARRAATELVGWLSAKKSDAPVNKVVAVPPSACGALGAELPASKSGPNRHFRAGINQELTQTPSAVAAYYAAT